MRPYLAVIKDSFREAFASRVLWIVLILILLFLLALAPLGYRAAPLVKLEGRDFRQPLSVVEKLVAARGDESTPAGHIAGMLSDDLKGQLREIMDDAHSEEPVTEETAMEWLRAFFRTFGNLIGALNNLLYDRNFFDQAAWSGVPLNAEAQKLLDRGLKNLSAGETARFNRLAFDAAFADDVRPADEDTVSIVYLKFELFDRLFGERIIERQMQDRVSAVVTGVVNYLVGVFGVIVALVVTSFIVPKMLDTGAVDLLLSKPVSRPLLLLSKFAGGCAFILLCTAFLNTGLWLIVGLRFGIWNSGLLWTIPVFVFVFAVYYSVSTAAAMVWRSAIVSIIVAVLFWAACFTVGFGRNYLEKWWLNVARTAAIMPAGDDLLVTNWAGVWSRWDRDTHQFTELIRGGEGFAAVTGYPFLGPLYDARQDRIVAVRIPLQAGLRPPMLWIAEREDGFVPLLGEVLPLDARSLMLDADGSIIVAGLDGIFRFQGKPTIDLQSMRRLGFEGGTPEEDQTVVRLDQEAPSWTAPFDAALDPRTGRLAVVSGKEVFVLEANDESTFDVVNSADRGDSESAVVGIAGDAVLVARNDGVIRILNRSTLSQQDQFQPFGSSEPRGVVASPDGRWLAVQFYNRKVWLYDVEASAPANPPLRAQGDVSAVTFDADGALYAADGFGRIIQYDPGDGFSEMRRWDPKLDTLEWIYVWAISPVYTVFPKPGEMDHVVAWLMTRRETATDDENGELGFDRVRERQQVIPSISRPLWSNLAFLTVMLTLTCVYFTRKEF